MELTPEPPATFYPQDGAFSTPMLSPSAPSKSAETDGGNGGKDSTPMRKTWRRKCLVSEQLPTEFGGNGGNGGSF